jgi:membrane-associated phospholipid phosphatase
MPDDLPDTIPIPPLVYRASVWAARRRRPAFLALLISGLISFILWLPGETRILLWADLIKQRGLISLLVIFILVTLSLIWSAGQTLDMRVFKLLNLYAYPKWLDHYMWWATQLGNMLTALIAALIFFLLDYRALAVEIVLGTFTLWLVVETIKALADRDRPFHTFTETRIVGWRELGDSFPSGHTSQIFFLMTLFIQYFQTNILSTVALYTVAALVGFTRIYVGAHYPRDVIAGLVLGCVWGLLAVLVTPYWLPWRF